MHARSILLIMAVASLCAGTSVAQQPQADPAQAAAPRDGRYLVYMRGIT